MPTQTQHADCPRQFYYRYVLGDVTFPVTWNSRSNWRNPVFYDEIKQAETGQDPAPGVEPPAPAEHAEPRHASPVRVKRPMTSAALNMPYEDVFLRRREAAELARVSVWTLDGWIRDYPDFPVRRLGPRTILIPKQDFVDWLRRRIDYPVQPGPVKPRKPKRR